MQLARDGADPLLLAGFQFHLLLDQSTDSISLIIESRTLARGLIREERLQTTQLELLKNSLFSKIRVS